MMARKPTKPKAKRGPKPAHLKIEGNWEAAVAKAVRKAPPAPKPRPTKGR